ncbi:MAG TPA: xanthine dehydrogenase family protein molybdopterin-binding subunit [Pyrinomonadaceae bacterium]|nr:xanthine dehydrogenase family protein molybdopterin-binding subunit [Pyrinomonadaceae bacterium]
MSANQQSSKSMNASVRSSETMNANAQGSGTSQNAGSVGEAQGSGIVGRPLDRVDGRLKVTGGARFAAEWPLERMAHAVLLGSTVANGRIKSFDTTAAESAPGVLHVMTHENAPRLKPVFTNPAEGDAAGRRVPLQSPVVYYAGQYIAMVVAETLEQAKRGAELIRVTYDEQPPAAVMDKERGKAYVPKQKVAGKPADTMRGDTDAGLAAADVRVDETYRTPTEHHNPMEPHATIAAWDGDKVIVYDATQYTYGVRHNIATSFGIPEENVHVVCKFTGGAFGCKGTVWAHVPLAAAAARQVQRPVKLVTTRQQMFSNMGHRAETEQHVVLGAKRDGRLTAIIHEGLSHTSVYDEYVEPFSKPTHMMYASDNFKASQRLVPINVGTPTYMRAPGECSGMFALESALDELAYKLNIDPVQLRVVNHADTDPDTKLPWSTKLLKESYRVGAQRFGWSRRNPQAASTRDGRYLVGMGMATAVYPVNHFPSSARVVIRQDGTALAESSTHDLGTGTYTILTQVASETLGLPSGRIEVRIGDTNLPKAMVSGGSSTAMSVGTSVQGAARAAIAKLVDAARADGRSPLYGASADAVVARDGRVVLKSDPTKGETYRELFARAGVGEVEGKYDTQFDDKNKKFSSHSFGAHFAEVRVDRDFGEVRVTRFAGAFDIGRALNRKTAESQMRGGIIMGIGMALMEESVIDPNFGIIVNRDLAEYHVPVHADVPPIDVVLLDNFDEHASPIGAKGAGEIGIVGAAAAVANAVYHATGVRVRELPITPDKLIGKGALA